MSLLGFSLFIMTFTFFLFHPERNPNFKELFPTDVGKFQVKWNNYKENKNAVQKKNQNLRNKVKEQYQYHRENLRALVSVRALYKLPPQFIILIILMKHLCLMYSSIPLKIFFRGLPVVSVVI